MKEFTYTIKDEQGIHARPATLLVKKAVGYESTVMICRCGYEVDAKSIFAVIGLGLTQGAEITVKVEGADEEKAVAELETFFEENL